MAQPRRCGPEDAGTPGTPSGARRRAQQHFVSVAIRIRPVFNASETEAIWAKAPEGREGRRRVCCNRGYIMEEYEFSRVFGPEDDNCELFQSLQGPVVTASVFSGVNETLFAYGQTGSGKTHTIFGTREESGLLQLFVRAVFEQAEVSPGSTVHACCYEVLGDTLTDLVDPSPLLECGEVLEEDIVYDEMFIKTQKCRYQIVRVHNLCTCLSLLQDARANRTAGVSSCNSSSSRSHAIVHLFVQNPAAIGADGVGRAGDVSSSIGALTLVDLAGTEKEHENPSEQGRKSTRLLNTSLSSLNRLLRRLQTGGLDESERRQSVLNKCLWEYLRPGCGISLIFCVNPLLRHRAITLSTLSMATDSKLIHSQRKAQYIQLPPQQEPARVVPQLPQFGVAPSPPSSARGPATPSHGSYSSQARTPRGSLVGTPSRTPRAAASSACRQQDFCHTPRAASSSGRAPSAAGAPRRNSAVETMLPEEFEQLCQQDHRSPVAVRSLALQNTKLRRKLSKARARSQERLSRAERERDALGLENTALHNECESLRALFVRQQQQQIAFWTGPFMEMIAPREGGLSLAASARSSSACGREATGEAFPVSAGGSAATAAASSAAPAEPQAVVEEVQSECLRSLRRERDYWRSLATGLKRDVGARPSTASLHKGHQPLPTASDLSTSHSHPDVSDPSRGAVWSGSDSGSEFSEETSLALDVQT